MLSKYENNYVVPISACDHNAQLKFTGIFNVFMDAATEHASILGIGNSSLRKDNCFWVAAKTKVKVNRLPCAFDNTVVATWPEAPGNIRCNRYCTLSDSEGVMVSAKTEWTIIDANTGRPKKTKDIYPEGLVHLEDVVCDEPFERFRIDFSEACVIATHKVVSDDIDMSHHMNNVAYIKAVFSAFTCDELDRLGIDEVEIAYKSQCYEGELLSIRRVDTDDAMEIGILKEDGTCAAALKIKSSKKGGISL